jgi:spore maturation protein CgeB
MKIALFCHSLLSDWNHGNAHFLRGVASELARRGHRVRAYENRSAWSAQNLEAELGQFPDPRLHAHYPELDVLRYEELDLDAALEGVSLVLVHEWNDPELVRALGRHRQRGARYRLLFHDTHHRSVSDEPGMAALDLSGYDGVLAFGETLRERYVRAGWGRRAFTWHEAADTRRFRPLPQAVRRDLIWIGNFGDEERTRELEEFLFEPIRSLAISSRVHGVRYPEHGLAALAGAGIEYAGYLPNFLVPQAFGEHRLTMHIPRRPYVEALRGIPTIRVFEALACGITLLSAPWQDAEGLFRAGDFVAVNDGQAMKHALRALLNDQAMAAEVAARGRETVLARHTCKARVDELLSIAERLGLGASTLEEAAQ